MGSGTTLQRQTWWARLLQKWPRSLFWRLLVCVPGIVVLLISAFMDKASPEAIWSTLAFGILASVLPAWMAIYVPLKDKRKSLLEARDEVLEPLKLDPPDVTASLKWLLPRWSRSMVYGRQPVDQKLDAWLDSSKPLMTIDGGPLVGKTRMAIEWADSLGPEWETGWLRHDKDAEALKRIAAYGRNTVVVVDGVPPHFAELIHDLGRHKSPPDIRVLLTIRNAQGVRIADQYDAASFDEVKPLHLGPIGDTGDRERWFEELCRHYADRLEVPVPRQRPGFIQELRTVPIGVLHAAALASARTGAAPFRSQGIEEIMYELWKTEANSWRNAPGVLGSGRDGMGDSQLERLEHAVVALSLLEPGNLQLAVGLLGRIPTLSGTDVGTLKEIADWAARTYPPATATATATATDPALVEFSPRIVVVAAFLHIAGNDRNFGHAMLGYLSDREATVVLGTLVAAAPLLPSGAAWVSGLVDSNPRRFTTALELALAAAPTSSALDRELARCDGRFGLDEDQTILLQECIPEGLLPMVQVALGELRVEQLRAKVSDNSERYEPELALGLSDLSNRFTEAGGRSVEALGAAQESLTIYQRLAADNPVRYEPDLALALNNLSIRLAAVSEGSAEALDAAQESVTIYQRLAADNPARYEPDLAEALNSLATGLAEVGGRSAEALDAAQKSVTIRQRLAAADPARYEPELARTLTTLSNRLRDVGGRSAEALDAAQKSVTIRQRLAAADPARYEPELALALTNLSTGLAEVGGRSAEVLDAAQESVTIYQRLAADNLARYGPYLATALSNLGIDLATDSGRSAEALGAARESVTIRQRLAADNPARYEPDLALAFNNLAVRLAAVSERSDEALDAAQESLTIYQRLAADNPARYEPDLALALTNLSIRLAAVSEGSDEALDAAQESLTIYQRLAADNPARYEPDLAWALNTLAIRLVEAGMNKEATESWKELKLVYERLAGRDSRFDESLIRVKRIIWERTQLP